MFQISFTDDLNTLLADTATWDGLAGDVPFRQSAWLGAWWDTFGGELKATVVLAHDDTGTLRGILPLYRVPGTCTLAMIGDGDACSDHVSVLTTGQDAETIAREMGVALASLATCSPTCPDHGWTMLDIDGVVEGDTVMSAFASGLKDNGSDLHASSRMSVWFKPVDENWDENLKHYGKTQRRKMRRTVEMVEGATDFEKRIASTPGEAEIFLNHVIRMHQRRWNEAGEPGSFADLRFQSFIHEAAQRFLSRGQLHVTNLRYQDNVIAGEMNIIGNNRIMYSYSAGYDTDYEEHEPGRILCIDGLRELYRQDLAGLDFMRGDETYKQRFATQSRRLFRVRATAPTMMPRLKHAVWSTGFEVKQWMRRQTGRAEIAVQDPTLIGQVSVEA